MDGGRKRARKWDVAAPEGISINQANGVGATGSSLSNTFVPQGLFSASQNTGLYGSLATQQPKPVLDFQGIRPGQPLDQSLIAKAQAAAAAAMANINKDLVRQGKLPPGRVHALMVEDEREKIARDVTINDAPSAIRNHLTKRTTQDDIARRTGTVVTVKGRYYSPGDPQDENEKPLYLRITPGQCMQDGEVVAQQQVNIAAGEVQRILQGQNLARPGQPGAPSGQQPQMHSGPPQYPPQPSGPPPYGNQPPVRPNQGYPGQAGPPHGPGYPVQGPPTQPAYPGVAPTPAGPPQGQVPLVVPLYLGIESAPGFDVALKVRGPDDSYIKHVATESGASVILKGRGSGMQETSDPLHIVITASTPQAFEEAKRLATNLIDTVRVEYQKMFPYGPPAPAPAAAPPQAPPQAPPAGYAPPGYAPRPAGHAPGAPYGPPPTGPPSQYPPSQAQPGYPPQGPPDSYPPGGGYMGYPPPGVPPAQAGYGYPPPGAGGYPPYAGQGPPPGMQGYPQYRPPPGQYPGGGPPGMPPGGSAPGQASPNPAGPYGQQQQAQAQAEERAEQQRKRRFQEFKEGGPGPSQAPVRPSYAPPPDARLQGPALAQNGHGMMGPPHPRAPMPMGPPPPRTTMGPPPPRPPQGGQAGGSAGHVIGSLSGLVDYGDGD